jgi:ribonuclease HII
MPGSPGTERLGTTGSMRRGPDLREELLLCSAGHRRVAGIDEAGRGPWAGPVCAAAVVLPLSQHDLPTLLSGVRDSKTLSPSRRDALLPRITDVAETIGVGWALSGEVDAVGIVTATQRAMKRALARLIGPVDALLIDYVDLSGYHLPQRSLAKADLKCLSVAAASIVAKVARDRLMVRLDRAYPGYGFATHKGYGTQRHAEALARLGPCPIHRMSWRPLLRAEG